MQESISLFSLFMLGGPVMWPLLVLLVAVTVIIIERVVLLVRSDLRPEQGAKAALDIYKTQGKDEAIKFCDEPENLWGQAVSIALDCQGGCTRAMGLARIKGEEAVMKLERPLSYLDMIASVAPILGFLGTVTGMIAAFKSIAEANTVQLQLVAAGLYEALFTTAFGLIIAVIATIAAHIFRQFIDTYELEQANALATVESVLRLN